MENIIMGGVLIGSGLMGVKNFENKFEQSVAGIITLLGIAILIN